MAQKFTRNAVASLASGSLSKVAADDRANIRAALARLERRMERAGLADVTETKTTSFTVPASGATRFLIDTSGGTVTATLPAVSGRAAGRRYTFKKVDANAQMRVNAASGEKIDGSAGAMRTAQWSAINVWSDGADWYIESEK